MLELQNIDLQFGLQIIFDNLCFTLFSKQKVGVVGKNGAGKTSLFGLILKTISADKGFININKNLLINSVQQEIKELDQIALDYVIAGHAQIGSILLKLRQTELKEDYEAAAELYQQLDELQGYTIQAQAAEILNGLGFLSFQLNQPIKSFSGGWRVRLSLARCLLAPSDLLLLDEPTNHLDLEAQFWLEEWLQSYPGSLLVISHDRDFLDKVTQYTLALENKQAKLYQGNYSNYEQQKAEQLALQQALYKKQQAKRQHMEQFINRFRAKSSKAKQVQSRLKLLEKLPTIACAQIDTEVSFEFFKAETCSNPLIHLEQVTYAYTQKPVLKQIDLSINKGDRIGLLGINGAGKSTLIKLIAGQIEAQQGVITKHHALTISYFAQHQLEILNAEASPLWHLQKLSSRKRESELRGYLGDFGFSGEMALKPVRTFSGGEKARLVLALIIWQKPNLLLLDEPTNHLDMAMREALTIALQSYEGALVVVAHDKHLLRCTVDEFWLVHNQKISAFDGDLDDYYQWHKTINQAPKFCKVKSPQTEPKNLSAKLPKLEATIKKLTGEIKAIDCTLAKASFYQKELIKANTLIKQRAELANKLSNLEDEWLLLLEQLEAK
ncbi:MAG: hypothetical protein A3E87_09155 [Gammaproteobacteria bacterium RIFCSPHIGHO2_12_FULL_35_23]|nr:MAG: hypothetical protein A3E87_09155 [Gammaproteobacteria bacterium RIFCSPHIGHO2_12_FULL_35_23]